MKTIEIIPIVYADGTSVSWQKGGEKTEDAVKLAEQYDNYGADGLLLEDDSNSAPDHERVIDTMKKIVRATGLKLYAGGSIRKMEDIKKYLYAGAEAVFLNADCPQEADLWEEASRRFGQDRVVVRKIECVSLGTVKPFSEEIVCEAPPGTDFCEWKQQLKQAGVPVRTFASSIQWSAFRTNSDGLMPVIVQEERSGEVLMMAYMNEASFEETIQSGKMCYWSRSRKMRWQKGETSGHVQYVRSLSLDCDNDTILAKVFQVGAACHTGSRSCFFQPLFQKECRTGKEPSQVLEEVYKIIQERKLHPKEGSYTNYLFDQGIDKILKKCGEEATEIVIAAKNPNPEEIRYEISDFLYHMMVLMVEKGVSWEDITQELANR